MARINTPDDVEYISHNIEYELPDGSTTVWLNEYVDAMVQAKVDEIVKKIRRIEHHGMTHSEKCLPRHYLVEDIIEQITGEQQK